MEKNYNFVLGENSCDSPHAKLIVLHKSTYTWSVIQSPNHTEYSQGRPIHTCILQQLKGNGTDIRTHHASHANHVRNTQSVYHHYTCTLYVLNMHHVQTMLATHKVLHVHFS